MTPDRSVSLHVPRYALWIFGGLLLAPWLAFAGWLVYSKRPQPKAKEPPAVIPAAPAPNSDLKRCKPGAWGNLDYFRILIEPPEEFILADYTVSTHRSWIFKGYTETALRALWDAAGLDEHQRRVVSDPANRETTATSIVIHPPDDLILQLSPATRARIYVALGEYAENFPQFSPYRVRTAIADTWFDNADLPAAAVELTKRLLYVRGTATCFSDEHLVLPSIPTPAQRIRYIKTLSRKTALVVQLTVAPGEDVAPLVEYWGRGGRSKDLNPLLQSLARRPHGGSIDIVHLMPRFARLLAYTYPLPSDRTIDTTHDCHWTSFNFQNEIPDERFSNIEQVRQVLLDQYYPVLGEPLLGDIVLFVRKDGVVVHSCVYIADDIVFTKNGPAFSIPWLLAPLNDVQAFYATSPGTEMRRYRLKTL